MVIIKKKDGMAYKYMKGEIKTQTCILTLIYINLGKHGYVRRKIEFTVAYVAPAQHIQLRVAQGYASLRITLQLLD